MKSWLFAATCIGLVFASRSLFSKEIVEFDLKNEAFKSSIPFDVPFLFKLNVDQNIKKVEIHYYLESNEKFPELLFQQIFYYRDKKKFTEKKQDPMVLPKIKMGLNTLADSVIQEILGPPPNTPIVETQTIYQNTLRENKKASLDEIAKETKNNILNFQPNKPLDSEQTPAGKIINESYQVLNSLALEQSPENDKNIFKNLFASKLNAYILKEKKFLSDKLTFYNEKRGKWYKYEGNFIWDRKGNEDYFQAESIPVRPNKKYYYFFEIYENLDDAQSLKINNILEDSFENTYAQTGSSCSDKSMVENSVNESINKINLIYLSKEGDPAPFKFEPEDVDKFINLCRGKNNEKEVLSKIINYLNSLQSSKPISFIQELLAILKNPNSLNQKSKENWNSPIYPRLDRFKDMTMSDIAVIWVDGLKSREDSLTIEGILEGKAKIAGKSICPADELDMESIILLKEFLKAMNSKTFNYNERLMSVSNLKNNDIIFRLISKLDEYCESIEEFASQNSQYCKKIKSQFTKKKDKKVFDVSTEIVAKDYFSLDFGVGYSPKNKSTFLYTGVNIYFLPVNKSAAYAIRKGTSWVFKRSCLLLGVTNSKISEGNAENLFANNNLLGGVGFRINQSIKINGGGFFFKEADKNPLLDAKHIKVALFFSASLDINILPLFGKLGNLF
jgi:hypothetical protein